MLKKIFSNTAAQLVAKFVGAALTLLTIYYTIRLAGFNLYGDLTKILVLVAVGMTAIDFGLNAEAIRSSHNEKEISLNLRNVVFTRLLLSFLAVIVLNFVIYFLPGGSSTQAGYSPAVKSIFWLGSLSIIFQGIYTSGNVYFQYHLAYWRSAVSVILGTLFGTLLTLFYLYSSPTLPHLVFATTLGYLLMAVITLLMIPRSSFENWRIYDLRLVVHTLRRSLPLGSILILSVLVSKIDTILLGIFRSSSEVGEYGFAYRIFDVILVLPAFTMNTVYPLLIKETDIKKSKKLLSNTTLVMGIISLLIASIVYFLAPSLHYVKPGMFISVTSLRYLSLSLPFFYLTSPLMWSLVSQKKDRQLLLTYTLALIFNFTLNYFFIPIFGAPAAALSTGATELLIFLSLLYFSHY